MYVCMYVYIYIYTHIHLSLSLYVHISIYIYIYMYIYIYVYIYIYIYVRSFASSLTLLALGPLSARVTSALSLSPRGARGAYRKSSRGIDQRNRNPRPQLEPQITSLDKCKIDYIILEIPVYSISGVGVGGSYSIGGGSQEGRMDSRAASNRAGEARLGVTEKRSRETLERLSSDK